MNYDYLLKIDTRLPDRLGYYADDLKAILHMMDELRDISLDEFEPREIDGKMRTFMLALGSIAESLIKESKNM